MKVDPFMNLNDILGSYIFILKEICITLFNKFPLVLSVLRQQLISNYFWVSLKQAEATPYTPTYGPIGLTK